MAIDFKSINYKALGTAMRAFLSLADCRGDAVSMRGMVKMAGLDVSEEETLELIGLLVRAGIIVERGKGNSDNHTFYGISDEVRAWVLEAATEVVVRRVLRQAADESVPS